MPHSLSTDLRLRVVAFIEEGHSRNEAAARFKTSVSFAVNLMTLWKETGSVEPRPRGGFTHGKAAPHKAFILATVTERPDITMPELAEELLRTKAIKIDPSNLSKFLIACGLSYKKKAFWQASKTGLTLPRRGWNGWRLASPSCVNSKQG